MFWWFFLVGFFLGVFVWFFNLFFFLTSCLVYSSGIDKELTADGVLNSICIACLRLQ